jgi:hypothetical protein
MENFLQRTGSLVLFFCLFLSQKAKPQGFYDNVFRYGQNSIYGSAKSMGMGGVQMGIGADGTAQFTNPAAPGMFRRSDIQFSLMPIINSTENTFNNGMVTASKSMAPIGSFSLSLASPKDDIIPGSFRGGVFSVSYNRLAIFDRKSNWEGNSNLYSDKGEKTDNSIIDYYLNNSNRNGYFFNDVISQDLDNQPIYSDGFKNDLVMAYNAFLLDRDSLSSGMVQFASIIPRGDVLKSGYWQQSLNQGVWNFGYAANFNDRLYLGASFSLHTSSMSAEVSYGEQLLNIDPDDPNLTISQKLVGTNFQIMRTLSQTQRAWSGNLGMIYKISDALRISTSIQLPSISTIRETFAPRVVSNFNSFDYPGVGIIGQSDVVWFENKFNYKMTLPLRYLLGFNYIAGKGGMIGLDLEYNDLSKSRLSEGDGNYNFKEENAIISRNFRPTLNVRLGGEYRFEDLRFRAGYAFLPSALSSEAIFTNNAHEDAHYLTGGLGGRYETWYWDAAIVYGFWKTNFSFNPAVMGNVSSRVNSSQLRLGVGFYF